MNSNTSSTRTAPKKEMKKETLLPVPIPQQQQKSKVKGTDGKNQLVVRVKEEKRQVAVIQPTLAVLKPLKLVSKRARDQDVKPIFTQLVDNTLHANKARKVGPATVSQHQRRLQLVYQAQLHAHQTDQANVFVELKDGQLQYIKDVDFEDVDDPAMCAHYAHEIMNYLMDRERVFMPNPDYIHNQPMLDWQVRAVVVDWLAEVQKRRDFLPETLYLGVNLMDRFLSLKHCDSNEIQKVGLACLFLAAKLEETNPVSVNMLTSYLNNAEEEDALLDAEKYVLEALEFVLWAPGPYSFIRRMSKADDFEYLNRTLTKLLVELSLLDHRMLPYPPSQVAAGCYYFARYINVTQVFDNNKVKCTGADDLDWSPFHVYASGYAVSDLIPIVCLQADFVIKHFTHPDAAFHYYTSKLGRTDYAIGLPHRMRHIIQYLGLQRDMAKYVRACQAHEIHAAGLVKAVGPIVDQTDGNPSKNVDKAPVKKLDDAQESTNENTASVPSMA